MVSLTPMRASSLVIVTAAPLLAFAIWVRHQRLQDGRFLGFGQAAAWAGCVVIALYASFFWLVFDRPWVMLFSLAIGLAFLTVYGIARGRPKGNAMFQALVSIGLPHILILISFGNLQGLFQAVHADHRVAEIVELPTRVYSLRAKQKKELVIELSAALDYEDLFVRLGAMRALRQCGREAAPAAERAAEAMLEVKRRQNEFDPSLYDRFLGEGDAFLKGLGTGAQGAVPVLRRALKREDAEREEAGRLLSLLGGKGP